MALLIKSAINFCHLTTRAKNLIVPQLAAAFTARSSYSIKSSVAAMLEHEVVPDVIAVAPSDKIQVKYLFIFIVGSNLSNIWVSSHYIVDCLLSMLHSQHC